MYWLKKKQPNMI